MDFIVIDTEGRQEIREIAILDRHGKLIYEAFNRADAEYLTPSHKALQQILTEFRAIAANKLLVFHHAKHDLKYTGKKFPASQFTLA